MMPGLRKEVVHLVPPLPPLYLMPRQLWAGHRFLQSTWLLPCGWQVGAQASLSFREDLREGAENL